MIKAIARSLVRAWSRTGRAPGHQYRFLRAYGGRIAATAPLPTTLPNGLRICCDLSDHIERCTYFAGTYEPVESTVFCRLLKPGMTVLDIGAYIGQYTLLAAAAIGAGGTVHAFEPIERTFRRLVDNVRMNALANVVTNRIALWDRRGEVSLGQPAGVTDDAGVFTIGAGGTPTGQTAPAMPLDEYVRDHAIARVDLVKIDVEGAEPFVFDGGRATLQRDRPLIVAEVNRPALAQLGRSVEDYWSRLAPLGYRVSEIVGEPRALAPLPDLSGVTLANVLFHTHDLDPRLSEPIPLKQALRWARSGW